MLIGLREQWLLSEDELNVDTSIMLGMGGFGTVFRGEFISSPVIIQEI